MVSKMKVNSEERYSKEKLEEVNWTKTIALTVVFTALVFAVTSIFYVKLSSTGYFNVGETMVYLSALIGGPIIGAIAGGIGSALADISLGTYLFAPATLVLKGLEGFVVGYLYQISRSTNKKARYIISSSSIALMIGLGAWLITKTLEVGFTIAFTKKTYKYDIPGYWLFISAILLSIFTIVTLFFLGEKGKMIFSCVSGGTIIVVGYFLYELALRKVLAVTIGLIAGEVPFNILQVLVGITFAVPIATALHKMGITEDLSETKRFLLKSKAPVYDTLRAKK